MSYRISITRITLDYFLVDVDDQEMEDPKSESEARAIARTKVSENPSSHQLGNQQVTHIVTSTQEF